MRDRIVVRSPYNSQNVPSVDVYSTFADTFRTKSHLTALVDTSTGVTLTFGAAERLILAICRQLVRDGFCKGSALALCARNSCDFPLFVAAALRLGGAVVGINHMMTSDDILSMLQMSNARFIFASREFYDKVKKAAQSTNIQIYLSESGGLMAVKNLTFISDIYRNLYDEVTELPALCDLDIDPVKDTAYILFSSGTTGFPKAVMLSHNNMIQTSYNLSHPEVHMISSSQVVYQPMCHVFGICLITSTFTFGTTTFIMPQFDLEKYIQLISQHKVSFMHVVPPVAVMLSKSPLLDKYDLSCVENIATGAGPTGRDTEQLLTTRLKSKARFRQVYGMTESAGILTLTPRKGHRLAKVPPGSVGLLAPDTQAMVVDLKTGCSLGPNQSGELWASGPQLMLGYKGQPRATSETIDNEGWLHTGDVGHYDENGFFFITDRCKELIKYKGYQVAPVQLELHLLSHPAVTDVGVFPIPDAVAGELPRAWVVRNSAHPDVTEQELHDHVNARVAPYMRLRGGIKFVPEIPRSATGKILRRLMIAEEKSNSKL